MSVEPRVGSMLMMFREHAARDGLFPVLERLHGIGVDCVEVSQIPMSPQNTADLERARAEWGLEVGALSVALEPTPAGVPDDLETHFDKVIDDCGRLGTRFVRIGMMPLRAMTSKDACEAWAARCEQQAQRLAAQGVTLCYHNHHVDLAQFDGERIFDLVRRVAPGLHFEVDLHWVQRGGMAPLDMLKAYAGVCKIIHVKDFRVVPVAPEVAAATEAGDWSAWARAASEIVQFAEVGQGNMNWPELLPAARAAGAEYFFIEQDETYGRDPFDCVRESREYLASLGW